MQECTEGRDGIPNVEPSRFRWDAILETMGGNEMDMCSTVSRSAPLSIMWKTVSEDCNLACDYCYYSRTGGKIGKTVRRIDATVLEKFIAEYMKFSGGVASFAWQGGEPLLAGLNFFKTVVSLQAKYAASNTRIANSVQTNATLLNEDWARFFKT